MQWRSWLYGSVGAAFVIAVLLTFYDQVVIDYGDDDSYLLGKATAVVFWILTLATFFALVDFVRWLKNRVEGRALWLSVVGVGLGFAFGFGSTVDWSMEWLIQGDIEVTFGPSELLSVVVGLWSATAAALILWLVLRRKPETNQTN